MLISTSHGQAPPARVHAPGKAMAGGEEECRRGAFLCLPRLPERARGVPAGASSPSSPTWFRQALMLALGGRQLGLQTAPVFQLFMPTEGLRATGKLAAETVDFGRTCALSCFSSRLRAPSLTERLYSQWLQGRVHCLPPLGSRQPPLPQVHSPGRQEQGRQDCRLCRSWRTRTVAHVAAFRRRLHPPLHLVGNLHRKSFSRPLRFSALTVSRLAVHHPLHDVGLHVDADPPPAVRPG